MSDVNLDGLERDEAILDGPRCANCGGVRVLEDSWCAPCLKLGRWDPKYLRAEYRWQITVPPQARLGATAYAYDVSHGPAVYKFVTRVAAEVAARIYSQLAKQHIEVEPIA